MQNLSKTSRYLSLLLRHHPEAAGLTLDEHGWADVEALIAGVQRSRPFDRATLDEIVRTDSKGRYSYNADRTKIRANQGHSIPVDVELAQESPPEILWHGTGERSVASIQAQGLLPRGRLYVHLSGDYGTAIKVGSRHGRPVVFVVRAGEMEARGHIFYRSVNGVWLTKNVPPLFLQRAD